MIKKWGLALMLLAMLSAPVLACGFPLPAGTSMTAVSKAVCAETEAPDSCLVRQDAYQVMAKLNSASINDLAVALYIDDGASVTEAEIDGNFDYAVAESAEYLGANVRVEFVTAQMVADGEPDDLSGVMFMVVDDRGYTSKDDGETWLVEDLDSDALLGLSFLLGLSGTQGASLDLFTDPTIFTVTTGEPVEYMGQQMIVQTLSLDLEAMLSNPEAILGFFDDLANMNLDSMGLDVAELGDPNELAMLAPMFMMFLGGTEVTTTLWIGADDGYIHYIEEYYALNLDLSATDPEAAPMAMTYALSGYISDHNALAAIVAPEGATEGSGGLLGDSGLGQGLFGGN